jgi:Mn2+/Fe2+ NRAMP family transporter
MFRPLFGTFVANTYINAFILGALIVGISTALIIEIRFALEKKLNFRGKRWIYLLITTLSAVIVGFAVNCIFRGLFGSGGGQLSPDAPDVYTGSSYNRV